jgi:hypothetical protein
MLVQRDDIRWRRNGGRSLRGASCSVQVSPLAILAQVGAVCRGVDGGGESVSRDSTRQLNRPATP